MDDCVKIIVPLKGGPMGSPDEIAALMAVGDRLGVFLEGDGSGEFDGDEYGEGTFVIYLYGPDADRLFAAVEPMLRAEPLVQGCRAVKCHGDPAHPEGREIVLPFLST
ncbi:hypothetical protein FDP22_06545 [Paroceanicella profunda]|uniref:Uncharacterized protein n=1 Tax=Paroceanicella profunda TaxID=2579971 RepID=A0A5B8FGP0_9RHOB|nr:hypothetical protein [Paroceanicella profunda]QDL91471.1 hypothetical protein FDP22_06545 [Paroceanicella profunda]